ncbi:unnamed protein product [Scytosiphon promiscuus]
MFSRRVAQVLGLGTATLLVVVGATLPSWRRQELAKQTRAAFCNGIPAALGCARGLPRLMSAPGPARRATTTMARNPGRSVVRGPPARKEAALKAASMSVLLHDEPTSFGGRRPFTSHAARWLIKRCIHRKAIASAALNVEVEARSNRAAMTGRWESISVDFQEMIFDDIQVTGGARFELLGVDLLTLGLLPGPWRRLRRLRRPCEVAGTSRFTDVDVSYSPAIRRLAQRVVNHALRPRTKKVDGGGVGAAAAGSPQAGAIGTGFTSKGRGSGGSRGRERKQQGEIEPRVNVLGVRVRGNKLAIEGEMTNGGTFLRVPFRYEFSLSASRDGHILHFKGSNVYWGTPGGHVPLPMLPLQSFNIDLGDRARIEHLRIAGGVLSVGGRFILTNTPGFTVAHQGFKRGSISFDLAESLSRVVSNILRLRRE